METNVADAESHEVLPTCELGMQLRKPQNAAITSLVEGKDTFVLLPTGGGKSLVYIVAGMRMSGIVLIISPLVSLIADQMNKLRALGLRACLITDATYICQRAVRLLTSPAHCSCSELRKLFVQRGRPNCS